MVFGYVVGVPIVVVLRDDKISHASIVSVISVPSFLSTPLLIYLFSVYSIRRYNRTYNSVIDFALPRLAGMVPVRRLALRILTR